MNEIKSKAHILIDFLAKGGITMREKEALQVIGLMLKVELDHCMQEIIFLNERLDRERQNEQ